MPRLELTLACADYEILRPIVEGRIVPDGVDLTVLTGDDDRLYRLSRRDECDIAEFNITEYFRAREHGHPITALPIFPHRRLRHGYVFVDTRKSIAGAKDLIGRPVGIIGRAPAAAVWVRGILQDFYGVPVDAVDWREDPLESIEAPNRSGVRDAPPVTERLLLDGEVDALIAPSMPRSFVQGDPRIARLFPDWKHAELEYLTATGLLPIMHVITVREELLVRHPWLGPNLCAAFMRSKRDAYERFARYRAAPIALIEQVLDQQRKLLGDDPWAYGLGGRNTVNLETILRYTKEQGRITQTPELSELFFDVDQSIFV